MRILLLVGDTIRSYNSMRTITREIKLIAPDSEVKILFNTNNNTTIEKTILFKPDVVLIGAPSTHAALHYCYTIKVHLKCKIISCMEEGVMTRYDKKYQTLYTGNYKYGPNVIDAHIFIGNFQRKLLGQKLLSENKCSSRDRLFTCGYVHLYFFLNDKFNKVDEVTRNILQEFKKENICMFLTGFQGTNYGTEELFRAQDIIKCEEDIESQVAYHLVRNKLRTEQRRKYTENILQIAKEHPDMLFLIKTHPGEQFSNNTDKNSVYQEYVQKFSDIPNIHIISGHTHIGYLMGKVGIMVHYGSSSAIFSYFTPPYTVCFPFYDDTPEQFKQRMKLGWRSDIETSIDALPQNLRDYKAGNVQKTSREPIKKLLARMYNYHEGVPYEPAKEFARVLTDDTLVTRQSLEDSPLDQECLKLYVG